MAKFFNKLPKRRGTAHPSARTRIFEAIETPNDFMLQKHGQFVIEMGRASDAIVILGKNLKTDTVESILAVKGEA